LHLHAFPTRRSSDLGFISARTVERWRLAMLIKRTNGASSGSRMSRMLGGVAAATIDRRTFFRRSGIVAGGLAAASTLGPGTVTRSEEHTSELQSLAY